MSRRTVTTHHDHRGLTDDRSRGRRAIVFAVAAALTTGSVVVGSGTNTAAVVGGAGTVRAAVPDGPDSPATESTKIVTRSTTFGGSGSLWGGAGDGTVVFDLFDESFDEDGSWGSISRTCFEIPEVFKECARIGAEIEASISGSMSMSLEFGGLSGGTVQITYPITVTFTVPEDNSFDPGEVVTIATAFEVDHDEASITVDHPELDAFTITTGVDLAIGASYEVCFFKCEDRTLVDFDESVSFPVLFLDDDTIGFTRGCFAGLEFLPIAVALGLTEYPNERCDNKGYVFDPVVDMTTVVTEHGGLHAVGSDTFSVFPVSLMTWALRFTPLPFWAIVNLDPVSFEGITLGYTTYNVISTALTTMYQDLRFEPEIEIDLDWGRELEFRIGDDPDWHRGTMASFLAGDDVHLRTDASLSSVLNVSPTVHLRETDVADISNIETVGNLQYKALSFDVETPQWKECFGELGCETIVPKRSYEWGPLLDEHIPIGTNDRTVLFDGSYPVDFEHSTVEFESFTIVPRPRVEIRSALRPVNAPGTFDLLLDDGSTGMIVVAEDVTDGGSSGMIVVDPGDYSISVANGSDGELIYYDAHIECVQRADEEGRHAGPLQVRTATIDEADQVFTIDLTGGEDLICTVLIRLPVPWECDAMTFDSVILGDPRSGVGQRLTGTTGNDVIVGYGGDDLILGLSGNDCVAGGEGDDRIVLGPGSSVASSGPGDNHIVGGADDVIYLGSGNNRVNGAGATILAS